MGRAHRGLGPGGCVRWPRNESWLVPPYRWRFDARAIQPTEAIAIDGEGLRKELEIDHDMATVFFRRFLGVIALRLEAARLRLVETYAAHS